MILHGAREFLRSTAWCALEEHVLEEMGEPCAELPSFVNAAGFDPGLHAGDCGGVVLLHEDFESVRKGENAGVVIRN